MHYMHLLSADDLQEAVCADCTILPSHMDRLQGTGRDSAWTV